MKHILLPILSMIFIFTQCTRDMDDAPIKDRTIKYGQVDTISSLMFTVYRDSSYQSGVAIPDMLDTSIHHINEMSFYRHILTDTRSGTRFYQVSYLFSMDWIFYKNPEEATYNYKVIYTPMDSLIDREGIKFGTQNFMYFRINPKLVGQEIFKIIDAKTNQTVRTVIASNDPILEIRLDAGDLDSREAADFYNYLIFRDNGILYHPRNWHATN